MKAQYDPVGGTVITVPVYESELAMKLIRLIIRELVRSEQEVTDFNNLVVCINTNAVRRQ